MNLPNLLSITSNNINNNVLLKPDIKNDITFFSNNQEVFRFNDKEIVCSISGSTFEIKDDQDFIDSFSYVIHELIGKQPKQLMAKLREEAKQHLLNEIGISGQRLIKLEKILNRKNPKE